MKKFKNGCISGNTAMMENIPKVEVTVSTKRRVSIPELVAEVGVSTPLCSILYTMAAYTPVCMIT